MASDSRSIPVRSEIDESYKWDLSSIYGGIEEWENAWREVFESVDTLESFSGKLGDGASCLLGCLKEIDRVSLELGRVFVYATMKSHEDASDGEAKAMADRAMALNVRVSTALAYVLPEILGIEESRLASFFDDLPELEMYRYHIEQIIRKKAHVLSAREEELLSGMGEIANAPELIFSMLTNGDMKFPSIRDERGEAVELSEERYYRLIRSKDRPVRERAFKGIHDTYESFRNTLAASFGSAVKESVFDARVHRYGSSREAALDGGDIPLSVYDNLIKAVREGLPLLHDYVSLRKSSLGLDELHMYDLYVPIVEEPEEDISWEDAKKTVLAGLSPLGDGYLDVLKEGFDGRWVDVYESQGKRKGAYSWGSYGTNPFVLLNYNGTLRDVFTLAHEMGHALHSWHSHKFQPPVYGDYTIFVAEVASTTNEVLLMEHMLENRPKDRPFLLNYYLEQVRTTVFRQTMFAEFELKVHGMAEEGTPLTPEILSSIWGDLNRDYYGPDIVVDKGIEVEWARIPHFYSPFYVYQYATGYSAATALAEGILTGGESARDRYIDFLKGGSSKSSIDLLRGAGVDMTSPDPVRSALRLFGEKIEELREITG
ncbi:oligoendopeptidase F [Dethiosulfovibrio peptidovorans DSM 11002]|uniref:Oligopeptidase F n=1 Tax=Dethiosulfovibrio peptidovorans DSM 11002 TaxID=469381 RepID=D2Z805_9BACT|nr:oligoendopeptidase F [Dethiosulfovibrio peptidovorans]EFC91602.1 oligoendopeptidase F [Dethiosulfovibrio peptidovorans DSM 11002]